MTDDEREAGIRADMRGRTMYEGREERQDEFLCRRLDEARAEIARLNDLLDGAETQIDKLRTQPGVSTMEIAFIAEGYTCDFAQWIVDPEKAEDREITAVIARAIEHADLAGFQRGIEVAAQEAKNYGEILCGREAGTLEKRCVEGTAYAIEYRIRALTTKVVLPGPNPEQIKYFTELRDKHGAYDPSAKIGMSATERAKRALENVGHYLIMNETDHDGLAADLARAIEQAERDARAQAIEEAAQISDDTATELEKGLGLNRATDHRNTAIFVRSLASAPPQSGWRPIESAPKDGTSFIAYGRHAKDCPIKDGRNRYKQGDHWWALGCWDIWRKGRWFVFCKDGKPLEDWGKPTHWMPLPAPPPITKGNPDV
jgi:hypothetical protein